MEIARRAEEALATGPRPMTGWEADEAMQPAASARVVTVPDPEVRLGRTRDSRRADALLERLRSAPSAPLGIWPTPVNRVARPGQADLLIKRDDLSGFGRGGAKARKLTHLLGHLCARGHGELLAIAGNVTNLAFDLLLAVDVAGIRTRLFIVDEPPAAPLERARIFASIVDRVDLLRGGRARAAATILSAYTAATRAGRRPFLALPGASHPACVIGNACGFLEMVDQLEAQHSPLPRAVYVTAATGTTVAGFLLAAEALRAAGGPEIQVIGVQVHPGPIALRTRMLLRWTERFVGSGRRTLVGRRNFVLSRQRFAQFEQSVPRLCSRIEDELGIRIDPIFGGKTWAAMEADAAANAPGDRPVMYWHCGYTPEWQTLTS